MIVARSAGAAPHTASSPVVAEPGAYG
jgi:hypothetical protein